MFVTRVIRSGSFLKTAVFYGEPIFYSDGFTTATEIS